MKKKHFTQIQVDAGKYNNNQKKYAELITKIYEDYPQGLTLPPEYGYFAEHDLLRMLIRLARYKFVARMVRKTDVVLEVGSGSGLGAIFLAQHAKHVTGLDIKTTEVEEARSYNKRGNVSFIVEDLYDHPRDKTYDVIVALDVIEHFAVRDGKKLIAKMIRHLNPTGMLILGTPSHYSYEYQSALSQASHIKCYTQEELQSLLDGYFSRVLMFGMNDELVHTGNSKMSWYYFAISTHIKK